MATEPGPPDELDPARAAARRTSVRERVRRSNRLVATGVAASISVRCECGTACRTWLIVESEVYARAGGRKRFVVARAHHRPELERVVLERRDYHVVELA
jgi:hypothetical protein